MIFKNEYPYTTLKDEIFTVFVNNTSGTKRMKNNYKFTFLG